MVQIIRFARKHNPYFGPHQYLGYNNSRRHDSLPWNPHSRGPSRLLYGLPRHPRRWCPLPEAYAQCLLLRPPARFFRSPPGWRNLRCHASGCSREGCAGNLFDASFCPRPWISQGIPVVGPHSEMLPVQGVLYGADGEGG